jgi:hypothetical protein
MREEKMHRFKKTKTKRLKNKMKVENNIIGGIGPGFDFKRT